MKQDRWISYHLYYHQDLDRVVMSFVHPTAVLLISSGLIDRFFFVRFGLGGPHVRLRLRAAPGYEEQVSKIVKREAGRFLRQTPSLVARSEEAIRQGNRSILASDPYERDDSLYPDNTLLAFPFIPETERYGGEELLELSLDTFTLSSVEALLFLAKYGALTRSQQLGSALRLLLHQALHFAMDPEELVSVMSYAVDSWGTAFPAALEKGRRAFALQQGTFCRLVHEENADERSAEWCCLGEAVSWLSRSLLAEKRTVRGQIGRSQLHMMANRIGLLNPEEVYLSQLLVDTLTHVIENEPVSGIPVVLRHYATAPPNVDSYLIQAFRQLCEVTP